MIKSVNNYPVSQLFDIEAGVVYVIPRYQREYTWDEDLANAETWSMDQIDASNTKLVTQAIALFKLNGGDA